MLFLLFLVIFVQLYTAEAVGPEGFFNGTSYASLYTTINVRGRTSISFKTCSSGQLLYQEGASGDFIDLSLLPSGQLQLRWQVNSNTDLVHIGSNLIDNQWHDVDLIHSLGSLSLSVGREVVMVANSSFRSDLFAVQLDSSPPSLTVGRGFTGCILQGAGVVLNSSSVQSVGVSWEKCPLPDRDDCVGYQVDHCFSQPCHKYSQCVSSDDGYHCLCTARYSGRNCDIDNGPLCEKPQYNQCRNGGMCQEDQSGNITVCACLPNFTGTFCETRIDNTFCDTQPCRNAGTCNINQFRNGYVCTCPQGFAGVDCELNIDECQSSPCRNNGSCTDEVNSYTCDCSGTGYRGSNCEVNINECEESNPCYTGSICFDRYGDYICECPPGFGGKNCDQEVNECDSDPCQNGGSCNDNLNGYLCHCIPGFAGINCEENIDDCASVSCPNNSHCVDGINTFSCVCNPGYAGAIPHCFEINECDSNPCVNGGTCHDRLNDFSCTCPHGFTGRFCEFNINDCVSDPCGNGGTCVDGIGKYTCRCAPGYSGAHCEIDINDCVPNPCQNSFRCVDLVNDYLCECLPGWEGKNCVENINECSSQPCMHGECIDLLNNYTCSCDPGYTGKFCEENINECEMSPCFNGGVCTDLVADFSCQCPEDFMGKTCSEVYDACQSTPCVNGGTCMTHVPSHNYTCSCPVGFEGDQCQINIDECEGVVCPAGQVCIDMQNSYQCGCPTGFTGSDCSVNINECSSNPCVNGTCVDGIGTYACHCPEGLTGKLCETDVDECQRSPCINGICQNFHGSFLCYCRPGYTGILCDIEFNECLSAPCQNGATCNDLVNNYSCDCVPGFSGRNCEINIDECATNPCQNGGTCSDQINMYECQCVLGFTGTDCETNIDECASQPCYNNGICVDLVNGFICNCTDSGFSGMFCETNIDDCASNPCQNGATCSDLIKDYHCNCYNGYDGKNCEIDIPECSPSPCQNNALCLENSNRTLYDINYLGLFPSFSYEIADGYQCICPSGFTGVNCETNIDDCEINACVNGTCIDGVNNYHCECYPGYEGSYCNSEINECEAFSPCQNGAPCTDLIADYKCDCLPEYGDKNCSTRLIGCLNQLCENGATCNPFLDEYGSHHYECICPQGFYGTYCRKSTTVSFDGMGQWVIYPQSGSIENYTLEFYFRTTLSKGIIAQGIVSQPPLEYILYLWNGSVRLNVFNNSGMIVELFSKNNQNDASWKFVQVQFVPSSVTLRVSGWVDQVAAELSPVDFTFRFGSISDDYSPSRHYFNKRVPNFVGCVQDVWVNGNIMIPDLNNEQGLTAGCPRVDQCANSPCSSGVCEDMWSSFRCICSRPYFGDRCQFSHRPGTFGYKDMKSYAKFVIPAGHRRQYLTHTDISMLLRTREESGLIFYVGTAIQDHSVYGDMSNSTFIVARLQGAKVQVIVKLQSESPVDLLLDKIVNDGNYYFLKVTRNGTELVAEVSGSKMSIRVPNSILYAEEIYIGGLPHGNRRKRQINAFVFDGVESYSFENITNFKGIIQDFRINNNEIEFYPLNISDREALAAAPPLMGKADLSNVKEGVLSDNPCEPRSPCMNMASCVDIWNDYSCVCPKGFRGKNCGEPEPCSNHNCPPEAECKNLEVGYECVAPASFNGKNSSLIYETHDFGKNVTNITFFLRSKYSGTIMHIRSERNKQYFLNIELTEDSLEVRWHFGPDGSTVDEKTVGQKIDSTQGELVFVNVTFSGNLVYLKLNKNTSQSEDSYPLDLGDILNSGAKIFVGHNSDEENHFKGCISEVRIAGILLPFVNSTSSPFITTASRDLSLECLLCWEEDCKHGFCQNSTGSYDCSCYNGYEGELCDIDKCVSSNPCQNGGECFHLDDDIKCNCTYNFTGASCNFENRCISLPCQHGGTCVPEDDYYSCRCSEHYEGQNCDIPKIKDCSSNPCQNGNCSDRPDSDSNIKYECHCHEGYEGQNCDRIIDFCKSNPCLNQGECHIDEVAATFYCICKEGFEGLTCDTEINYCANNPCLHGKCYAAKTSYRCHCYPGYIGQNCAIKIQSCSDTRNVCHNGTCFSDISGYRCSCNDGYFGKHCYLKNLCDSSKCNERGTCNPDHDSSEQSFDFNCSCNDGYTGKSCAEKVIMIEDDTNLVIIILVPVMCLFILCLLIGAVVFLRIAKKKRATRGTYSPSRQEMFGSRVEMNHVMKPPPEERLI